MATYAVDITIKSTQYISADSPEAAVNALHENIYVNQIALCFDPNHDFYTVEDVREEEPPEPVPTA